MSMRNYKVIKELGRGAFGTVVLVSQGSARYCVKQVDVRGVPRREREAALKEASILHRFDHPNIVQYKEQFIENNTLYIVMELAEDGDLHNRLRKQRGRPLSERTVLDYFVQICLAMQHVHGQNVLHRDLKPQNIFLSRGGTMIKVGDFGISKELRHTHEQARTKVGTPYYMSPEAFKGRPYDGKSDIWSLGCVLYELATLRHPFEARTLPALAEKVKRGKYTPLGSSYSEDLRQLIRDMLQREPAKRPDINEVLRRPIMMKRAEQFQAQAAALPRPIASAMTPQPEAMTPESNKKPATAAKAAAKSPAAPAEKRREPMVQARRAAAKPQPRTPQAAAKAKPQYHPAYSPAAGARQQPEQQQRGRLLGYAARRADGCLAEQRREAAAKVRQAPQPRRADGCLAERRAKQQPREQPRSRKPSGSQDDAAVRIQAALRGSFCRKKHGLPKFRRMAKFRVQPGRFEGRGARARAGAPRCAAPAAQQQQYRARVR